MRAAILPDLPEETLVRASASLARSLCQQGMYGEALDICRSVHDQLGPIRDPHLLVPLLLRETDALLRLGDLETAESVATRCLVAAEREGDSQLIASACGQFAQLLRARGRLDEALRLYARSGQHHRKAGDIAGLTRVALNRGALLNRLGRTAESLEAFRDAYRHARAIGHVGSSLRAAIGMGMMDARSGRLQRARARLLRCWRESRRMGMQREECLSLEFLGEALIQLGRVRTARRALSLCRRRASRLAPEGDLVIECDLRLGFLAAAEKNWHGAGTVLLACIEGARRIGMRWEEAHAHRLLSFVLAKEGRGTEAASEDAAADALFRSMGNSDRIDFVRGWIRRIMAHDAPSAGQVAEPRAPGGPRSPTRRRAPAPPLHPVWQELGLITGSPVMIESLRLVERAARAATSLFVIGETGTGKELVARGFHRLSGRTGRFVPFNCAACPENLVECELFGAARGAYTGAVQERGGLIQEAEGGTLLLDEVGDLSLRAQGSLLRFLDSGEVRPLGSTSIRVIPIGVVSAAQPGFRDKLRAGVFREDLYFRLTEVRVELPPLRERTEDLPLLMGYYWDRCGCSGPIPAALFDEPVLSILRSYPWPGNVRELIHLVRALCIEPTLQERMRVDAERVRCLLSASDLCRLGSADPGSPPMEEIRSTLSRLGGNVSRTARALGISRQRVYRAMKREGG